MLRTPVVIETIGTMDDETKEILDCLYRCETGKKAEVNGFTADWQGNRLRICKAGQKLGTIHKDDPRFLERLGKILQEDKKSSGRILIPNTTDGEARLESEVAFFRSLLKQRMQGYQGLPSGANCQVVAERVFSIVLSHCEEQVVKSFQIWDTEELIGSAILPHIVRGEPIPIFFSLALTCRVDNSLKFFERTQLPHLGWIHFLYFFAVIQAKVQVVYKPGISVVVFDETSLFCDLLGLDRLKVDRNRGLIHCLARRLWSPVEIVPLEKHHFPWDVCERMTNNPAAAQVYAMACSLPEMTNRDAMRPLYRSQAKDYSNLQQKIGRETWQQATEKSRQVVRTLGYRKENNLFSGLTGINSYLDGCVTDKSGRLSFDITSPALVNHGMPVIQRNSQGRYKIRIVPEYRIAKEFPQARPIRIRRSEFGLKEEGFFIFFYEM